MTTYNVVPVNDRLSTPPPAHLRRNDADFERPTHLRRSENEGVVDVFISCGCSQQDPTTVSLLVPMYADHYFIGRNQPQGNEAWKIGKHDYLIYIHSKRYSSTQIELMTKAVFRKLKCHIKPADEPDGLINWIKKNSQQIITNI